MDGLAIVLGIDNNRYRDVMIAIGIGNNEYGGGSGDSSGHR